MMLIISLRNLNIISFKKVKVSYDQEMTQSERNSHSKNQGGRKQNVQ